VAAAKIVCDQLYNIYSEVFIGSCDNCRGTGRMTCPHCHGTKDLRRRPGRLLIRALDVVDGPRDQ
jgi:hypothetical protein